MTKRRIKFRCKHTYPRYEFETDKWHAQSDVNEDYPGETYILLTAECDSCGKDVHKAVTVAEMFEMVMTIYP